MKGNRVKLAAGLSVVLAVAIQTGCAGPSTVSKSSPQGAAAAENAKILSGKVAETMDAGPYTYILLDRGDKKSWVAVPTMKVSVGQEVQLQQGVEMGKFTSKTLNKTFDNIIFSSGPLNAAAEAPAQAAPAAVPSGHPAMDKQPAQAAAPAAAVQPAIDEKKKEMGGHGMMQMMGGQQQKEGAAGNLAGKVVETFNSGGYTYLSIEKDGKKSWAAVPVTEVKVGQDVEVQPGIEMTNFKSKTLNRTFDSVIFSGGVTQK